MSDQKHGEEKQDDDTHIYYDFNTAKSRIWILEHHTACKAASHKTCGLVPHCVILADYYCTINEPSRAGACYLVAAKHGHAYATLQLHKLGYGKYLQ